MMEAPGWSLNSQRLAAQTFTSLPQSTNLTALWDYLTPHILLRLVARLQNLSSTSATNPSDYQNCHLLAVINQPSQTYKEILPQFDHFQCTIDSRSIGANDSTA